MKGQKGKNHLKGERSSSKTKGNTEKTTKRVVDTNARIQK